LGITEAFSALSKKIRKSRFQEAITEPGSWLQIMLLTEIDPEKILCQEFFV
jgi:hypothetical protein